MRVESFDIHFENGMQALKASRWAEAEAYFRKAARDARVSNSGDVRVADAVGGLAQALDGQCRHREAACQFARSISLYERAGLADDDLVVGLRLSYAGACLEAGEFKIAEEVARREVGRLEEDVARAGLLADAVCLLVDSLIAGRRPEEAHREAARVVCLAHDCDRMPPESRIGVRQKVARLLCRLGYLQQAELLTRSAVLDARQCVRKDDLARAAVYGQAGAVYLEIEKNDDAAGLLWRCWDLRKKSLPEDHEDVIDAQVNFAMALSRIGQVHDAYRLCRDAIALAERTYGRDSVDLAAPLNNLAQLALELDRQDEAEHHTRRALAIVRQHGRTHLHAALVDNLGSLCLESGKVSEAEALYREALDIVSSGVGEDHPDAACCLNNLASLLSRTGRLNEAEQMFRKSLGICERHF
ncbi:MAG: tetratricopeptide repeat protein, partial [Candidatus Sericytochromatia bacterium]|nr:tetratricopeptide repeat protein [Candidatus Tanganyikabacteria bacterium]